MQNQRKLPQATWLHRAARVLSIAAALTAASASYAQKALDLTIASSHPTSVPIIGVLASYFVPEVNKRLAASGNKYKVNWRESWGGQLYKTNATLTSVQQGVTDIGWIFTQLEASKMPLYNVSTVAPFTTGDSVVIAEVMQELAENNPAMRKELERNNLVFLGATAVDTYHLFTKKPVTAYTDLKGRKISAPGSIGLWLRNSGAVPVDGNLTTFYTDIQAGVSEGTVSIATGILPTKVYEVAPYITTVNIGALCVGTLAMNKDSFDAQPPEVQKALKEVGREYTKKLGQHVVERAEGALRSMVQAGTKQTPPVSISAFADAERQKWIKTMPNIATDWVKSNEAKGLPAKQVLAQYMDGLRKRGVKPARDWDKE